MPLQEERTGWGVWFFLFLFHTPIYTNEYGDSIPKIMCRKKQHIYIVIFFRMKILICCKPAVIDKFNLLADSQPWGYWLAGSGGVSCLFKRFPAVCAGYIDLAGCPDDGAAAGADIFDASVNGFLAPAFGASGCL